MSNSISHLKISCLAAGLTAAVLVSPSVLAQVCQINLSETTMDFGRVIPLSSNDPRNVGNVHELGNRLISLNASCPNPSKLMLRLQGQSQGSKFKFAEQGQMSITLSNALLDGNSVDLAQVKSSGETPSAFGSSIVAVPGDRVIPVSGGIPVQGSVLSVQVEVRPQVPVSELRTRDMKTLEALLSFQISGH